MGAVSEKNDEPVSLWIRQLESGESALRSRYGSTSARS